MPAAPALTPESVAVRTTCLGTDPGPLLDQLPDLTPVAWIQNGEGLVGWGEAFRLEVSGPDRFARAERWWADLCADFDIDDEVGVPGTGAVAFASFGFADRDVSTLIVPRIVMGSRGETTWVTRIGADEPPRPAVPVSPPGAVTYHPGATSEQQWRTAVVSAVDLIQTGELHKVVLARDVIAQATEPIDPRWLLRRLAKGYPHCWTFVVAGLVGATPELLLRVSADLTSSLVLAGSAPVGRVDVLDTAKNRSEHAYAVDSLVRSLTDLGAWVHPTEPPHILTLPNVLHFATDVTATLPPSTSLLAVAAAVHPTASIGGTPTKRAVAAIAELEGRPRGRYAGMVGYLDAHGGGDLGLALRCAQLDGSEARLWAGCGIVADSDPEQELAETEIKLRPLRDALSDG